MPESKSEKPKEITVEQKETGKPNFFKNTELAIENISAVEGLTGSAHDLENWRRNFVNNDIPRIMERNNLPENADRDENWIIAGFQGIHGFNRWGVRKNGTIAISESHSFRNAINKAKELGLDTEQFLA